MKVATYLTLWHGRKTTDENLDDWGSDGPTFGPFDEVTITYGTHVKASQGDKTLWFDFTGDLIEYEGVYYGDFTIFAGESRDNNETAIKLNTGEAKLVYNVTTLDKVPEKYFG